MNVLIVHAHENASSFSSALAELAKNYFEDKGDHVDVSNLYQKQFNPIAGKHDFVKLSNASHYKYASEQIHAHTHDLFSAPLKEEMQLLDKADLLIFNFPLWWFGMPAILKGWVDKVLAYGFAYGGEYGMGPNGRFKGRKALLTITTGSPESFYQPKGVHTRILDEDILRNIKQGILHLVGYEVLESFIAYEVSRIGQADRMEILENYKAYLETIH